MNKLEWQFQEGKTLAVDIYKTKKPYDIKMKYIPIITGYTGTSYEDYDVLDNETYYYTLGYYKEDGSYIITVSRQVNATTKDVYIDATSVFVINDYDKIDSDPRLCYHNYYKSLVNDFNFIIYGRPRTFYSRFNKENSLIYVSGANNDANNTVNGRINCTLPSTLGTGDFTIEFFGTFPNEENTVTNGTYFDIGESNAIGSILFRRSALTDYPSFWNLVTTTATKVSTSTVLPYSSNKYSHYCLMRKNGVFYIFVNGQLGATYSNALTYNITKTALYIGANYSNGASITGYIDSFRITKTAIYNIEGFDEPTEEFSENVDSSVILLIKCDQNTYKDYSTYNIPLTSRGGPLNCRSINSILYGQPSILFKDAADKIYTNMKEIGQKDFTIECKIKPDLENCPASAPLISIGPGSGNLYLYIGGTANAKNGRYIIAYYNGVTYSGASIELRDNEWQHVAFIRKGTTVYLLINGVLAVSSIEVITTPHVYGNLVTLACRDSTTSGYIGYMTDIRITLDSRYNPKGFIPAKRLKREDIYKDISFDITANNYLRISYNTAENDVLFNVHKSNENKYDESTIIADNLNQQYYIDTQAKLNNEYYYAASSTLPNRGIYNFSKMKYYFEKDADRYFENTIGKFTPNIENPNKFYTNLHGGLDLTTTHVRAIDHTKMKNFCYSYGSNATANNTVNGGFSIPMVNPDLTDWCIEMRCQFLDGDYTGLSRLWNMGQEQTSSTSTQTGIWMRFNNNVLGLGLYNGSTAIAIDLTNVDVLTVRKAYDICLERKNGIFYVYLDGKLKHTISQYTNLSILAPYLHLFTNHTRINPCPGYFTNIRYTASARYNGEDYEVLNELPKNENDPLWNKVKLLVDFDNVEPGTNDIIDKSPANAVITKVGSIFVYNMPNDNKNYYLFNGVNSCIDIPDAQISTHDYTVELDFMAFNKADTLWRTIFSLGKMSSENFVKVCIGNDNRLYYQIYKNSTWVKIAFVDLFENFYTVNKIAVSKTKNIIRCYFNKRLIGIYENESTANINTNPGFCFGKHSTGEYFRGIINNIRISNVGRYTEDKYFDDNFDYEHELGTINNASGFYNGIENILRFDSVGSFDHYDIRRIDRLQHKLSGTLVASGVYNNAIDFVDSAIVPNKSYGYILTLYGGDKLLESQIVNIYTSSAKSRHIRNIKSEWNLYDVKLTWETGDVLGYYYIYKSESPHMNRIDKSNRVEVTSVLEYIDSRPTQNKQYYYFIEHYQNNELIGFGNIGPVKTDIKGALAINVAGFYNASAPQYSTNLNLKQNSIFNKTFYEKYHKNSSFDTFGKYEMRTAGNFTASTPGFKYFNFNMIGMDLGFESVAWTYASTYASCILSFEDDAGNVYAVITSEIDTTQNFGTAMKYGTTSATTTAGKTGNVVAAQGYFEIRPTSIAYKNIRASDYVNSFTINNANMYKVTRLKISNLNTRMPYTSSAADSSWYAYLFLYIR